MNANPETRARFTQVLTAEMVVTARREATELVNLLAADLDAAASAGDPWAVLSGLARSLESALRDLDGAPDAATAWDAVDELTDLIERARTHRRDTAS